LKAVGKEGKHPKPKLHNDLLFIWDAFAALSSSRNNQIIVINTKSGLRSVTNYGYILFSEIESWLNLNGIFNVERRQEVAHFIRIMDEEYIKFMREKHIKI